MDLRPEVPAHWGLKAKQNKKRGGGEAPVGGTATESEEPEIEWRRDTPVGYICLLRRGQQ